VNRRSFLSLCGLAAGSCLVPDAIARAIRDACVLAERPYLVLPRNPSSTLYAYRNNGKMDFTFYLGDPTEEEKTPTWREYFDEYEGIDVEDEESVADWWREHVGDPSRFQLSCLLDCRLPTLISPTGDPAARLGLPRVRVRVITHAQAHLDI